MSEAAPSVRVEDLLTHYAWVQRIAMRLVRDRSLADDVAQQTFLTALQSPPRDGTRVRAWLARVATNVARQEWRRGASRARREAAVARTTFSEDSATSVARAEAQKLVLERVLELEEPFRTTILLRYREELRPREIAARHGVPVETVRSRIRRGLAEIRGRLREERGDGWRLALVPLLPLAGTPGPGAAGSPTRVRLRRAARLSVAAGLLVAATATTWVILARSHDDFAGAGDGEALATRPVADAPLRGRERAAAPPGATVAPPAPDVAAPAAAAPREAVVLVPWSRSVAFADPTTAARDVLFRFRPFPPPKERPASEDVEVLARVPGTVEARLPLARADGTPIAAFMVTVDDPHLVPWGMRIDAQRAGAAADPVPLGPLVTAAIVRGSVEAAEGLVDLSAAATALTAAGSTPVDQVTVAADGSFRLRIVPGVRHVVSVAARDRRPSLHEVVAGPAEETSVPSVRLEAGRTIRGTVRDVHGEPVARATVHLVGPYLDRGMRFGAHVVTFGEGRAEIHTADAKTDAAGRFSFGGLRDAVHSLDLVPPGTTAALRKRLRWKVPPADGDLDLVVEAATLRITARRGEAAAPGVRVSTLAPNASGPYETGPDGTLTLLVPPGEETAVEVGRQPDTRIVRLPALAAGESASETVEVPAAIALAKWRVHVRGLADPAAKCCGIRLEPLDGPAKGSASLGRDVAVADGGFVVEGVMPGRYRARVRPGTPWDDPRNLSVEDVREIEFAPGGATETTIEVRPAGRIEVTARDEAGTRVMAPVRLRDAAGNHVELVVIGHSGVPGTELSDHVAADGPTSLHPALPPGTYTLVLDDGRRRAGPLTVVIRAGEVTKVEAMLRP